MSSTARTHQTQWAAQFAVASELCKLGYEVAFTSGHTTPIADIMGVSPRTKTMFLVDVKGLYRPNPWVIKRKPERNKLFYIFAFVPVGQPNQYFILRQQEAYSLISSELKRLNRPDSYTVTGFTFKQAEPYRDKWDSLPE
jgi:hypothetical protein